MWKSGRNRNCQNNQHEDGAISGATLHPDCLKGYKKQSQGFRVNMVYIRQRWQKNIMLISLCRSSVWCDSVCARRNNIWYRQETLWKLRLWQPCWHRSVFNRWMGGMHYGVVQTIDCINRSNYSAQCPLVSEEALWSPVLLVAILETMTQPNFPSILKKKVELRTTFGLQANSYSTPNCQSTHNVHMCKILHLIEINEYEHLHNASPVTTRSEPTFPLYTQMNTEPPSPSSAS